MSLIIGFDAGGTFTDSVIFNTETKKIISSGKSLTTNFDLSQGIKKSLNVTLKDIPTRDKKNIKQIIVSSTLATNSLINSNGCRVGLILIGFDKSIFKNKPLVDACNNGNMCLIKGGHDAEGNEKEKLDFKSIQKFVEINKSKFESIAIASQFSTRNPDHENRTKEFLIKKNKIKLPITCSHELSYELNGPRRAITCALNASLTHIISDLLNNIELILKEKKIIAKIMVVKGDGSLIDSKTARYRPIDTTMSGPAASCTGAAWLTGKKDAIVVDIGGTSTDISLLNSGYPEVSKKGARIGVWDTMVEAISISTQGLGGDSEILFEETNANLDINLGPKRVVPLSILAERFPSVLSILKKQSKFPFYSHTDCIFVWKKNISKNLNWLSKIEKITFEKLHINEVFSLSEIAPNQASYGAVYRLIKYNLVEVSSFTPTDAVHVLGIYNAFNTKAANLGALIISKRKNKSGEFIFNSKEQFAKTVLTKLFEQSAISIFNFTTKKIFNNSENNFLNNNLFCEYVFGQKEKLAKINLKLNTPIISIGASAASYYPKIASLLNTKNITPENFQVAGAVGAAIGSIKQTVKILITKDQNEKYRVHFPSKVKTYSKIEKAINDAKFEGNYLSKNKCILNGATKTRTKTEIQKKEVDLKNNKKIFLEYNVISTTTGEIN